MYIPIKPHCPRCKTESLDNLNMVIQITTEQPLAFYKKLPNKISLNPKTSHNSSWVNWDHEYNAIICRKCGMSSFNGKDFDKSNIPDKPSENFFTKLFKK